MDNWLAEWNKWIPQDIRDNTKHAFCLDSKLTAPDRLDVLQQWHRDGGIAIMGYEVFRSHLQARNGNDPSPMSTLNLDFAKRYLLNPGPDVIICDEAQRIKNPSCQLSSILKQIKTRFRICLTGYPLQNNLEEYWTMVDFVNPGYLNDLGTFRFRFVRDIVNGMLVDSTFAERRIGRQRLYVLHKLLDPFVFRLETKNNKDSIITSKMSRRYDDLAPCEKVEYTIKCRLSLLQYELYTGLLEQHGFIGREKGTANDEAAPVFQQRASDNGGILQR